MRVSGCLTRGLRVVCLEGSTVAGLHAQRVHRCSNLWIASCPGGQRDAVAAAVVPAVIVVVLLVVRSRGDLLIRRQNTAAAGRHDQKRVGVIGVPRTVAVVVQIREIPLIDERDCGVRTSPSTLTTAQYTLHTHQAELCGIEESRFSRGLDPGIIIRTGRVHEIKALPDLPERGVEVGNRDEVSHTQYAARTYSLKTRGVPCR